MARDREDLMTGIRLTITIAACALVLGVSDAQSQTNATLPVPGVDAARDVPGAHELPDPGITYKVLFDFSGAMKPDEPYAGLQAVARYVNTLAKAGVPADHRKIAIIFHQGSTDIVMNNDAFKSRYDGKDNPNIAMVRALKHAGVDLHVCGQAVLARKIEPKTIQPEIQLDLWALTTIVNLESRGYVRVGGGS
jgi:intracellular sulfur oxidation DsrE/DsrF family protein